MGFSHVSFTEKFSLLVQALVKELTIIKLNNYPYQLAEMFPEKAGWYLTSQQHAGNISNWSIWQFVVIIQ